MAILSQLRSRNALLAQALLQGASVKRYNVAAKLEVEASCMAHKEIDPSMTNWLEG